MSPAPSRPRSPFTKCLFSLVENLLPVLSEWPNVEFGDEEADDGLDAHPFGWKVQVGELARPDVEMRVAVRTRPQGVPVPCNEFLPGLVLDSVPVPAC